MARERVVLKKKNGYLVEVPVWEAHKRGRNWLAVITEGSHGKIEREFLPLHRGHYFYYVEDLERGDVIEFGADYYTSSGRKHPKRVYAVVLSNTEEALEIITFDDPWEALEYELPEEEAPAPEDNIDLSDVEELLALITSRIESIKNKIKEVRKAKQQLQQELQQRLNLPAPVDYAIWAQEKVINGKRYIYYYRLVYDPAKKKSVPKYIGKQKPEQSLSKRQLQSILKHHREQLKKLDREEKKLLKELRKLADA